MMNDGTGMAIRLRCSDVLEWVLLMMAWDADKSQDLFGDDLLHLFWWGQGRTIPKRRPIIGISRRARCSRSARPFHVGT